MSRHPGIEIRTGSDGRKVSRVRIYSHSRYVAGRSFNRLTDARAWREEQLRQLKLGTWVAPADTAVTVAEWITRWQGSRRPLKPSSAEREQSLLRNHVVPEFGRRPLSNVSPMEVQAWANRMREELSVSSARQAVIVLRQAYAMAVVEGIVGRNPAAGIRLGKPRPNQPRPLTHAELWRLVRALPGERDRLMVLMMGYGGLRFGEVVGVRVGDIVPRGVHLVQAIGEVRGRLVVGTLKDGEARTVPLPEIVMERLRPWAKSRPSTQLMPYGRLIAATRAGTPIRNGNWRRVLDPAVRQAGLAQPLTPHNLRDTAASLAIASGATVVAVARMLGHSDPSVTLKHYAGLFPDDLDQIATRLDREARREAQMDQG